MTGPLDPEPTLALPVPYPGLAPVPPRTRPLPATEPAGMSPGPYGAPRDVAYPPRPVPPHTMPPHTMPPHTGAPHPALYGPPAYPGAPQLMTTAYPQPFHPVYGAVPQVPVVNVTQTNTVGATVRVRRGTNHALHLVLTLLTCGLWAPVWLVAWVLERR